MGSTEEMVEVERVEDAALLVIKVEVVIEVDVAELVVLVVEGAHEVFGFGARQATGFISMRRMETTALLGSLRHV